MAVAISVPLPFIDTELNGKSRKEAASGWQGERKVHRDHAACIRSIMNVHYLSALCAFARAFSRRCLLRDIFLAKPQRSQGDIPNLS